MHYTVLFVTRWRHNFREIAVKNYEKSKNRHTTTYRQLTDLKKIPSQLFRAENVDVHLYNFFPHIYIAQTAIVKVRMGSPKTARNEQVCVHQKCYRK